MSKKISKRKRISLGDSKLKSATEVDCAMAQISLGKVERLDLVVERICWFFFCRKCIFTDPLS